MKASEVKGMSVLSITDGTRLGVIQDLFFDAKALRVVALTAQSDKQTRVIPFAGITSIGRDAVTVEGAHVTQESNDKSLLAGLLDLRSVIGLKVVDTAGTLLGKVEDLETDPENGRLSALSVHQSGRLGLGGSTKAVPGDAVHSLGPELVMVEPRATAS